MRNIKNLIIDDMEFEQKLMHFCQEQLKDMPEGYLNTKQYKGKIRFYHVTRRDNGKGRFIVQRYIKNEQCQLLLQLRTKGYLEKMLKNIKHNYELETRFLRQYKPYSVVELRRDMSKAYQEIPELFTVKGLYLDIEKWDLQQEQKIQYRPEGLTKQTIAGIFVRSKSEVIIADALFLSKIPFKYEFDLGLGFLPDFVIILPNGEFVIWEHFGLMKDQNYREKVLKKIETFQSKGYVLGKNLIFTFDDLEGNISSKDIQNIIEVQLSRKYDLCRD